MTPSLKIGLELTATRSEPLLNHHGNIKKLHNTNGSEISLDGQAFIDSQTQFFIPRGFQQSHSPESTNRMKTVPVRHPSLGLPNFTIICNDGHLDRHALKPAAALVMFN